MTYEQWKAQIDEILDTRLMISYDDLPDTIDLRQAYNDEMTPLDVVHQAMREVDSEAADQLVDDWSR